MRERMQGFMAGRYGTDQLSKLILWISLACLAVSMFTRLNVFYILGLVLLIYTYYRMFSRNVAKRYAENQKYLNWRYGFAVRRNKRKVHWEQRKIYRFYKCPQCRQKVRVPKGKGKVAITCPKCRMEFVRKS
ncbi:MAG: hypothetical protein MR302_01655 [Lachnospiraceae bacterium]|nr:hypothetical protein [Lachnospiraceae bacterium]MDD7378309.1 hypothetical protein [Lachnospiraceae bacterium]